MTKLLICLALFAAALPAYAATAVWTGAMEYVTTVTYKQAIRCEYSYYGNTFWRVMTGSCLRTVEVE